MAVVFMVVLFVNHFLNPGPNPLGRLSGVGVNVGNFVFHTPEGIATNNQIKFISYSFAFIVDGTRATGIIEAHET